MALGEVEVSMATFFTADQHFGHENIIKYCDRPFKTVTEMDRGIIKRHNDTVGFDDTVYMIGDFSMSRDFDFVRRKCNRLNGTLILILGNHDYLKPFSYVEAGFQSVHTALAGIEGFILHHDPVAAVTVKHANWLCGHAHGLFQTQKNIVNVGVDVWDYSPVALEVVRDLVTL